VPSLSGFLWRRRLSSSSMDMIRYACRASNRSHLVCRANNLYLRHRVSSEMCKFVALSDLHMRNDHALLFCRRLIVVAAWLDKTSSRPWGIPMQQYKEP
jgi:hypothetical protein